MEKWHTGAKRTLGLISGLVGTGLPLIVWTTMALAAGKPAANILPTQASRSTFTVGKPLTKGNLTIFPVYGRDQAKIGSEYLTLEEALKQKVIQVKEMPDAEVSRVSVTNKGSKMIYLMAGDLILGGQQDRIISRDTIVPVGAKNFIVEVFCVEHGRWGGGQHFEGGEIASSSLRRETQQTKQQDKVWNKVAREAAKTKSVTRSGTYRAVAGNKATQQQVASYTQTLNTQLAKDRRALGLVVAINGRVTAADVFADSNLFHKQRAKILKSYALDAMQEKDSWSKSRKKPVPSVKAAQQLLKDGESGTQRTTARAGATLNSERENRSTVTFDAMPKQAGGKPGGKPALVGPSTPAHRNIYRK